MTDDPVTLTSWSVGAAWSFLLVWMYLASSLVLTYVIRNILRK